jgi:hypothetical protein
MNATFRAIIVVSISMAVILTFIAMVGVYIAFGQDKVPTLVLVNNSGQGLTITSAATVVSLTPSTTAEVPFPSTPPPLIVVRTADGHSWKYMWVPLDGASYGYGPQIYMQIEADGTIYVLPGKVKRVSKPLPVQPVGYPLKPQ